jgi:hypothetical protein
MDDIVAKALVKWPNVPACYGWLGLDARGNWYMRDDRAQAAGPFAGGTRQSKGSLLQHEKLICFIQRNYAADALGRWYFQNGPQRVFVELEATPWVWRINSHFAVSAHEGQPAHVKSCLVDEFGHVYLDTDRGFGLVHTQDVAAAADAIQAKVWLPQDVLRAELPARFGYVQSPARHTGAIQNL